MSGWRSAEETCLKNYHDPQKSRSGGPYPIRPWRHAGGKHPAFDAVINLAAKVWICDRVADPWAFMETNLTGILNLIEYSRQCGIKKFAQPPTGGIIVFKLLNLYNKSHGE